MANHKSKHEELKIPKLDDHIKAMNGRSTRQLKECIEQLQEELDNPTESRCKDKDCTTEADQDKDRGPESL